MNDDTFRFCQADDAAAAPASETPSSRPDSATPEEGQLGTVTLDELFYLLTDGALGVEPKRAQPTTTHANTPNSTTLPPQD